MRYIKLQKSLYFWCLKTRHLGHCCHARSVHCVHTTLAVHRRWWYMGHMMHRYPGWSRQMRIISPTIVIIVHWHPIMPHKVIGAGAASQRRRFVIGGLARVQAGIGVIEHAAQQILGGLGDGGRCDGLHKLRRRWRIVLHLREGRVSAVGIFARYRVAQLMLLGQHQGGSRWKWFVLIVRVVRSIRRLFCFGHLDHIQVAISEAIATASLLR